MKTILLGALCLLIGFALGFALMFWVAKEMVRKVRVQEAIKHQELIDQMNTAVEGWVDAAQEIVSMAALGSLQNKSPVVQTRMIKQALQEHTSKKPNKAAVNE